ncbi:O-antigen ligase family protein [Candidatus Woesearchaeota archaeon]|jgi:O-antigen ligase|nr:O-antigen ligase family protein [Candidatus Woesearchaeota archaeon]
MSITSKLLFLINSLMGLFIFILPSALIAIPKGGGVVALMLILSLVGLAINRDKLELSKWEKYFVFSFIFYFAVIAINLWWFDGKLHDLDTPSRLVLVLPIYFFIRKTDIKVDWFIWGVVLGSILAGLIKFGIIDVHYLSKIVTVQTGSFTLLSSIFALSSLMFVGKGSSTIKNTLLFVAFASGIVASFMSGGRGVWIAAILSLIFIFIINPMRWSIRLRLSAVLSMIILFYSAYLIPQTGVKNRIDLALKNTTSWVQNGQANTSSGARLEMWKASYQVIKENPFFGVGEDNYSKYQQILVNQGKVSKSVEGFLHPHGEYVTSLVEQGFIGLIAFISVLLTPLIYLLCRIKLNKGS